MQWPICKEPRHEVTAIPFGLSPLNYCLEPTEKWSPGENTTAVQIPHAEMGLFFGHCTHNPLSNKLLKCPQSGLCFPTALISALTHTIVSCPLHYLYVSINNQAFPTYLPQLSQHSEFLFLLLSRAEPCRRGCSFIQQNESLQRCYVEYKLAGSKQLQPSSGSFGLRKKKKTDHAHYLVLISRWEESVGKSTCFIKVLNSYFSDLTLRKPCFKEVNSAKHFVLLPLQKLFSNQPFHLQKKIPPPKSSYLLPMEVVTHRSVASASQQQRKPT